MIKILLHEQYQSGNMLCAGPTGVHTGASGINDLCGRMNFGSFDFPQTQAMSYTTNNAGNITSVLISGNTHFYAMTGSYNIEENPISVRISGTSIGSTIEYVWYYQNNGSLVGSTGSIISGTCILT